MGNAILAETSFIAIKKLICLWCVRNIMGLEGKI